MKIETRRTVDGFWQSNKRYTLCITYISLMKFDELLLIEIITNIVVQFFCVNMKVEYFLINTKEVQKRKQNCSRIEQ